MIHVLCLFQMHLEATLLQAKVHFFQCSYQSSLTMYEQANLDTVTVSSSAPRLLHIIAEAYAIKGIFSIINYDLLALRYHVIYCYMDNNLKCQLHK